MSPIPRTSKISRVTAVAAMAALGLVAASTAQAACQVTPVKKTFAAFGDNADYSLAPGGDFESGAAGWSLGGASIVSGTSPFKVGAKTDSKSLAIPSTAKVVSSSFCAGAEHPNFRFFARRTSGSWGVLYVKLRYADGKGRTTETTVGALNGNTFAAWSPSGSYVLAGVLPIWSVKGATATAQVILQPDAGGGNWQVDDVYIDPYRRS